MPMEKRYCTSCRQQTLHNSRPQNEWRCTYCGYPTSTNPAKREQQESVRNKQVLKLR